MKPLGLYMALPHGLKLLRSDRYIEKNLKNVLLKNCYVKWDNI